KNRATAKSGVGDRALVRTKYEATFCRSSHFPATFNCADCLSLSTCCQRAGQSQSEYFLGQDDPCLPDHGHSSACRQSTNAPRAEFVDIFGEGGKPLLKGRAETSEQLCRVV